MELQLIRNLLRPASLDPEFWEYVVLLAMGLPTLVLMVRHRRWLAGISQRRPLALIALLIATVPAQHLLVIELTGANLLPTPGYPITPSPVSAPLLGVIPILAAGVWMGPGAGLLVGVVSGLLSININTSVFSEPLRMGLLGLVAGYLLRQDYRGRLAQIARQPLVAGAMAALVGEVAFLFSVVAYVAGSGLAAADYAFQLTRVHALAAALEVLAGAALLQGVYLLWPQRRPVQSGRQSAPYARSLSHRMMAFFVPLVLLMTGSLLVTVTLVTIRTATSGAASEMVRVASNTSDEVTYFLHTGRGLLAAFANDERLWGADARELEGLLQKDLQTIAFFNQLLLFSSEGELLAAYPPTTDTALTADEERLLNQVLNSGAPRTSPVYRAANNENVILSLLEPIHSNSGEISFRVLLGRTDLTMNPMMDQLVQGMQWTEERGEGLVVSREGYVVAHPQADMLLAEWVAVDDPQPLAPVPSGVLYENRDPLDNTRQLVHYLPVSGQSEWAVVIQLPYEVVLERAWTVAKPVFLLLTAFGGVTLAVGLIFTNLLTGPLSDLAGAADRIAHGDLSHSVRVHGEDEVGRVGQAFENMRSRLEDRMSELSLLLKISRAVSAELTIAQGIPFVLEGAMRATDAFAARIVVLDEDGEPERVIARGKSCPGIERLDQALVEPTKGRQKPLIVENLVRARHLIEPPFVGPIRSLIALPIRIKDRVLAVIWIAYRKARPFDEAEVSFLSTLAGQATVLIENANLFQKAEGGRRRLAAILDSTADAILVTDRDSRILLVNPAAERAFDLAATDLVGHRIDEVDLIPTLVEVLQKPSSNREAVSEEVFLPSGRTLYANVSTIQNADGEHLGRIAVLRDITRFKELDEMKTEFLSTVSHDLRAPLMFMRGYAGLLLRLEKLNEKERAYVQNILDGVEQINDLVSDLLDLRRIESGVGFKQQPCHLQGVVIEAVDALRARAQAKGIMLQTEPAEESLVITGDSALLRRAVINLIDNAIKYTDSGGRVTVGLSSRRNGDGDQAIIRVADTGIGIAPDDQVRLFEKFYRIKRRETAKTSGAGIGLAIVKSVAERHDGHVWLDSQLGKGSTFYIGLPLREEGLPDDDQRQAESDGIS